MDFRNQIQSMYSAALQAVMPRNFMSESISLNKNELRINNGLYDLDKYKRIFVFGSGKASADMAGYIYDLLGKRIERGLIIGNQAAASIDCIEIIKSTHPLPSQLSIDAAERMIYEFRNLRHDDLFIYLLSGGSSALMEKPVEPITLYDLEIISKTLIKSGMSIDEINVIRKHLSAIKGGRLGRLTPASGIVLVLSDVIGDDMSSIGSGPMYHDKSSFEDAERILKKYQIWDTLPETASGIIEKGKRKEIEDTLKHELPHIQHYLIGNNVKALLVAKKTSKNLGIPAHIITSQLKGEAKETALFMVSLAKEISLNSNLWKKPVMLIFGGETTVTVHGPGRGGRNQELALAVLREIKSNQRFTFLSVGTDGVDGNSDAAGAIVDYTSYLKADEMGLDINTYLTNNDSNNFFQITGDLIQTGPTGTNVGDIAILMVH